MITALCLIVNILSAQERIDGVCLTGPPREVDDRVMKEIHSIGAEWVTLMPYAYGPNKAGEIFWDTAAWQWWGETSQGIQQLVIMAQQNKLKVMLKPHLWLGRGDFTGTFDAGTEANWKAFERSYQQYLLHYAWLAQQHGVDMLCIGTELSVFVERRTGFWQELIGMVRSVYTGPLTYAANWDEAFRFPLWKDLDLIGVDAYFPLSGSDQPTEEELIVSWSEGYGPPLVQLSDSLQMPIVFTEVGYRCIQGCTEQPWSYYAEGVQDLACQRIAFQAMFKYVTDQPWYAGCFIWKWFAYEGHWKGRRGNGFSPQGRPALHVIKKAFEASSDP